MRTYLAVDIVGDERVQQSLNEPPRGLPHADSSEMSFEIRNNSTLLADDLAKPRSGAMNPGLRWSAVDAGQRSRSANNVRQMQIKADRGAVSQELCNQNLV
ncbi:MAG TPA: hypothetical protein VFB45_04970 [Pseudolabrys sp.]|nr:hypothetical protein [Pseudolabrys sp.]